METAGDRRTSATTAATTAATTVATAASPTGQAMARSALHDSPFHLLGVTTRDDRRTIMERAEDQALHLDPAACQKARSELTHPRMRLSAEVAWLPGLPPDEANALLDELGRDPFAVPFRAGLPQLARANLMSAALGLVDTAAIEPSSLADLMRHFGDTVSRLDAATILGHVNGDRALAGFPQVQGTELVEEELDAARKRYKSALKDALNGMASARLIETMTLLAERATQSGTQPAPPVIDDLVDSYAVETQGFLDREEKTLSALIDSARAAAPSGAAAVTPVLDKLETVARNWTRVAKPIQLSMMARGMSHRKSAGLAYALRSLGIDLFNAHNLTAEAERMTRLLRELFAEVGEVAERLAEDAKALQDIANNKAMGAALAPLRALCKSAGEAADTVPGSADQSAKQLAAAAPKLLSALQADGMPAGLMKQGSDEVAQAMTYCIIAFGNKTSEWSVCAAMLKDAKRFATEAKTQERIAENLRVVERNVTLYGGTKPVKSAPSLFTMNGCGFTMYGKTNVDAESTSYMTTYYFVLFAVPIFPICRYRVISTGGNGYRFLAKGPLRMFDKVHLGIVVALFFFILIKR